MCGRCEQCEQCEEGVGVDAARASWAVPKITGTMVRTPVAQGQGVFIVTPIACLASADGTPHPPAACLWPCRFPLSRSSSACWSTTSTQVSSVGRAWEGAIV